MAEKKVGVLEALVAGGRLYKSNVLIWKFYVQLESPFTDGRDQPFTPEFSLQLCS